MGKTDNPHATRLYDSLCRHVDTQTAERIAYKIPLSKSADADKKFAWAESVCADLESTFDDDKIKQIRMDCACGPEMGKIGKMKKLYQTCKDIDDFVLKANALNQGFTVESKDNALFLIYPTCYCSCVKRIDKRLPELWCYCTLGYTKKMFEHVFGREVDVELMESVKTGGSRCVIKVIQLGVDFMQTNMV